MSEITTNFTNPSMNKKGQRNTLKKAVVPNTLTLLQHVDFMHRSESIWLLDQCYRQPIIVIRCRAFTGAI